MKNSFSKDDLISFIKKHGIEGCYKEIGNPDKFSDFQVKVLGVLFILRQLDRKVEFKSALFAIEKSPLSIGEILALASFLGVCE